MCKCVLLVLFSLNVCVCSLHNCCVCEHVREEENMVSASALISKHSSITGLHELFKQKSHQQMCLLFRHVDISTCCICEYVVFMLETISENANCGTFGVYT